ncbi:RDD family protein [Yinghuangia seranimata]|uniref:RDD family protein n=1 Tax=Yinghuangia seranimata TaxID=408067 RepID=UPI00248C5C79|nr:RDD family protein [Yinghuangia seranimata]MDI2132968.1 RDD family protein [Yinghuangia seranimata]
MSDLVTGEAVALDLRPARLPSRALAFCIDVALQAACLLLFGWGLGSLLTGVDPALATALVLVLFVAVVLGWPVVWETTTHGKSPGKMALGLRVVRDDGGPVRFRHSLVRGLVGVFADFWTTAGCGAVISSLASTKGKRLGDQAAGTFVVLERTPGARHVPVAMHPAAAAWAAGLDLSGLTDDLALHARQYLGRVGELDPVVAGELGTRLAGEVAARIGVPPPMGVHPAEFLAAVLAERQRRAYEKSYGAGAPGVVPSPVTGAVPGWGPGPMAPPVPAGQPVPPGQPMPPGVPMPHAPAPVPMPTAPPTATTPPAAPAPEPEPERPASRFTPPA